MVSKRLVARNGWENIAKKILDAMIWWCVMNGNQWLLIGSLRF